MKEWSSLSKYNSFNSYKGLTYYEHYKKIVKWLDGKGTLPPPIEASLDPINACNQRCYYCNSQRYLREHPAGLQKWDKSYIRNLLLGLARDGVKAFCWGGGGEALLNDAVKGMTEYGVGLGMEASIITNGVLLDKFPDLKLCRWVGVSLDSADSAAYKKVRGTDDCETVLHNVQELVNESSETAICVKALILPETLASLYYTCQLSRDYLDVDEFHIRPVDLERRDYKGRRTAQIDEDVLKDVLDACRSLETKYFRVYSVMHKYTDELRTKQEFKYCFASPLVMQLCTDKKMYVCVDHRLELRFEIKEWGSEQHRQLLKSIDPSKECSKCTWCEYNRQVEEVVIEDKMCVNFP